MFIKPNSPDPPPSGFTIYLHYMLIYLSSFKHKIITTKLADRLACLLPKIISKEKNGFINGRRINCCTCLTSEAKSLINKNSGNMALKIDISKAFDILHWPSFLGPLRGLALTQIFLRG